jgi:hypothetical protein
MPMTPSPGPVPLGSNPYGTPYPGAVPTAPANRRWWLLGGAVLVLVAAAVLSIVLAATSG